MKMNGAEMVAVYIKEEVFESHETERINVMEFKEEVDDKTMIFKDMKVNIVDPAVYPQTLNTDHNKESFDECTTDFLNIKPEYESEESISETMDDGQYKYSEFISTTDDKSGLNEYLKTEHKQIVDDSTNQNSNFETHAIQKILPVMKCEVCQACFNRKKDLRIHVNVHHPDLGQDEKKLKVLKCENCPYKTTRKISLVVHKANVHGAKFEELPKYNCASCNFSTHYKNHLNDHLLIHSGEKPFKCEFCDYSCVRKFNLKKHKINHAHGESPNATKHNCPMCAYSTYEKGRLKRHMFTHSKEKPIFCQLCDYRCIQKVSLRSHMKSRHQEKT